MYLAMSNKFYCAPLFFCLFLCSLFLSSCVTFSTKNTVTPVGDSLSEKQAQQLNTLKQWSVTGKLGFRLPDEAGSAFLNWEQINDSYSIHLSGPLNIGAVSINGDFDQARIEIKNETHHTQHPEFLFYDNLGWPLPIRDITWWIKGLPAPDTNNGSHLATYDDNGLLKTLEQNQWLVSYVSHTQEGSLYLPNKIIAKRDDIKLTFILKRWMLN